MWEERLLQMPKIDLHCHLDGSLPLACVEAMLGRKVDKKELWAGEDCQNLSDYLDRFQIPLACIQTAGGLRAAAREFLLDVAKENIRYIEVRFAPLSSVNERLNVRQIVEAVLEGLQEAKERCGVEYNVIVCAMRHHSEEDSLAMLKECREYLGAGVCAADLAGHEAAYPMERFRELFAGAKRLDFPFTIHAGECGRVKNVLGAVECGASRIGHGIALRGHPEAIRMCVDRGIGIEMCPVSNLQTRAVPSKSEYPIREFLDAGLFVTLNTDNRTVSNTSMTKEMRLVRQQYGVTEEELRRCLLNAVDAAFADDAVKHRLWKLLFF